jgi:hypothetical protein
VLEEQRLKMRLPLDAQPVPPPAPLPNPQPQPGEESAPTLIMRASGFDKFGPMLVQRLCGSANASAARGDDDDDDDGGDARRPPRTYKEALSLVRKEGTKLWRAAVDRAQGKRVEGTLPRSDDRPLYWARLTMRKALRQWQPSFTMTTEQRAALIYDFERHSRGQHDWNFPSGSKYKRILVSGFDPFTLGNPGTEGTVGQVSPNIRIGNPSGATILSLDGQKLKLADGTHVAVETYILPVNYTEFNMGMVEDTVGPHYAATARANARGRDGDDDDDDGGGRTYKPIHASISVSQGGGFAFNLEHWNGRFHGPTPGNDELVGTQCPGNASTRRPYNPVGCNVYPPERWLGYNPRLCDEPTEQCWMKQKPPQFTAATLPFASMMLAGTGKVREGFQRPPGDTWPVADEVYGVFWGTDYSYYPDCTQAATNSRNPASTVFPRPELPIPPGSLECARQGAGGDYLSNEVAYRNTLVRDIFNLRIPAGHIHTPVMTRFGTNPNPGNGAPMNVITDATFEAYRDTIVEQTRQLIFVVAQNLNEGVPPVGMPPN